MKNTDVNSTRTRAIQYLEDSILARKMFLNGFKHSGFVFLKTSRGNSFHLLKNKEYMFCGKNLIKIRLNSKSVRIFQNLSEIKKSEVLSRRILCKWCEARFLGLYKKDRFPTNIYYDQIYAIPDNDLRISKELINRLKFPFHRKFPCLKHEKDLEKLSYNYRLI